jgi:hypothetical protein
VFVTSNRYSGKLNGLAGADVICQGLADEEDLPGDYVAWLSDGTATAGDRLVHATVAYQLLNGAIIADDLSATYVHPRRSAMMHAVMNAQREAVNERKVRQR